MPRVKSTNASAQPVVAPAPIQPPLATPAEAPKVKKIIIKKKKVTVEPVVIAENVDVVEPTPVPAPAPTPEPVPEPEPVVEVVKAEPELEEEGKTEKKRARRQVTKETYFNDFESFFKLVETELSDKKSLLKQVKQLKTDSYKLLKIRNLGEDKKSKGENSNSGFMKPVLISEDLASFIGVHNDQPITRVLITKKICQHIKEKDLQNPNDRREILPDQALKKLFNITDADTEPLTYYSIQKRIQRHIFKAPAVATTA